jgi:hypothetical protein
MNVAACIVQNRLYEVLESYGPKSEEVDALLKGDGGRKTTVTTYVLKFHNGYVIEVYNNRLAALISQDGHKRPIGYVTCKTLADEVKAIAKY